MKITRIELKNFLGLYNGSGKKSITVDFTKGTNNKVTILSGGNGKGKSFLISCLHPFASTLDNRSKIIIDGENGYKEVHYDINNKEKAIIKHHYNQGKNGKITMKSFFSLSEDNGTTFTELNPNGTVTSFKQLVLKHLEVDEAYFKIARVGTNVTNFIDMPTAERKKYISLFLPDVDIYLENYKKINDKYNVLNKNIKFVTQEINKLDDEDNLNSNLENAKNNLTNLTSTLEYLRKELNENIGKSNAIDPDGTVEKAFLRDYNSFNAMKSNTSYCQNKITALENELEKVEFSLDEIIVELTKLTAKEEDFKSRLKKLSVEVQSYESELEEKNIILNKYSLDEEEELEEIISSKKERIESLTSIINSDEYKSLIQYTTIQEYEIRQAINIFNTYKESTKSILDKYSAYAISEFFNPNNDYTLELLEEKRKEYNSIKKNISNLDIKKRTLMTKIELVSVLSSRPSACKIDSCPFISKALEYKDVEKEIELLEKEITDNTVLLDNKEKEVDEVCEVLDLQNEVVKLFKLIHNHRDILNNLPYANLYNTYEKFISNFNKDKDHLNDFQSILTLIELKQELSTEENQLSIAELKLSHINERKNSADIIQKDCDRLELKIAATNQTIADIAGTLLTLVDKINKYENYKEKLTLLDKQKKDLVDLKAETKHLSINLNKMKSDIDILKDIKKTNKDLTDEIEKIEKQISPLEKEKERLSLNLRRLNDFKESKDKLEKDYYDLSIIRDALSNTKGIPLLFIELYLKKIKAIANDLLDISFNGKFFIEDFNVTESDFFISVRKSEGELVGDISQASQGEQALTSIALSFALVQQSTRAYNVLALDEMDSTLDSNNRRAFIDVVETQLKEMNVEQCFIISHNEAFDTYPANLILFEGTNVDTNDIEYMKNKTVLYQNK